jgi:ABC-type branched-subunit amino acid transport system permease subunit
MTILTEKSGTILSSNPTSSRAWIVRVLIVATTSGVIACFIDPYLAYVATSWVIFGLLGFSLDLVWGRAGILSLGQTAFYGIGGYVGSTAAINLSSLTGNTIVWSVPCGAIAGFCFAALIGWFIFYGRLGPLQATILTYTFTLLLWTGSISFNASIGNAVIGGDNGLANVPGYVVGFGKNVEALGPNGSLICTILIAAGTFILVGALMRSPFGLLIDCIRLNADKAEMLGYDVRRYQLHVFVLAGSIAGIAGALYGSWANYLTPSVFSVLEALLVPI